MDISLPKDNYLFLGSFVIPGNLPRKSNSRVFVTRKDGSKALIKSSTARAYAETFALFVPPELKGANLGSLKEDLLIIANVYYQSRHSDLSIELFLDLLEEVGVIENDRYVREQLIFGFKDKDNPRTEVALYQIKHGHEPIKLEGISYGE